MTPQQHSVHLVAATVGFISLAFLWLSVLSGTTVVVGWAITWSRHQTIATAHRSFTLVGLTLASVHALAQLAVPGDGREAHVCACCYQVNEPRLGTFVATACRRSHASGRMAA